jgi:thymidylate synthase
MYRIEAINVRHALPNALAYVLAFGIRESSRAGDVIAAPEPVAIRYFKPKQHVLISPIRDANPFFHLMEAMWMLAGRNDAAFLDRYVHDFGARFAVDGIVLDAYGHRWRNSLGQDQLREIISQLRREPTTRQCVLQMWGAGRLDLWATRSKPCNMVVTFRIVNDHLNMVVHNRSNDLIWGACGSNAVHFPLLQEYVAQMVGVPVGEYWQVSDNLHVYQEHIDMLRKRIGDDTNIPANLVTTEDYSETKDLINKPKTFDYELDLLLTFIDEMYKSDQPWDAPWDVHVENDFLNDVVAPMSISHWHFKNKRMNDASDALLKVRAPDWQRAASEWLERRCK